MCQWRKYIIPLCQQIKTHRAGQFGKIKLFAPGAEFPLAFNGYEEMISLQRCIVYIVFQWRNCPVSETFASFKEQG